jgi:hypothetical protein
VRQNLFFGESIKRRPKIDIMEFENDIENFKKKSKTGPYAGPKNSYMNVPHSPIFLDGILRAFCSLVATLELIVFIFLARVFNPRPILRDKFEN